MILKAGQARTAFRKPDPALWCVLVFGEDDGVVTDMADEIAAAWARSTTGGARQITLDEDDIRREPQILSDRLETGSLLGETDIIRVRTSGEKIAAPVLDLVASAEERGEAYANRLIVMAGGLNKRSRLRTTIEAARTAAAIHLFADTEASLKDLVRHRLAELDVDISEDALEDFVSLLPGHRGLANQESEKLALFGHGLGRPVSLADVRRLCQTDADNSVRDLVQAALDGDGPRCQAGFDRIREAGLSAISVLRVLEMEVRRLLEARGLMGTGGDIGRKLRPPVWQSEWPAFRTRMDRWSAASLTRLLAAIHDLELQAKQAGPAADPALRMLLLNVVRAAGRQQANA